MYMLPTANKSLAELRQLYFKMKDQVFGTDRFGFAYNTAALEKLLKEEFGTSMRLGDVTTPRCVLNVYLMINIYDILITLDILFSQGDRDCCLQEDNHARAALL